MRSPGGPQLPLALSGPPPEPDRAREPAPRRAAAEPRQAAAREARPARGRTAQELASRQREISVSEFFSKNRHLLGFDNPVKALLTAVKEAVDNSLDACEEAGILPDLTIEVREVGEDRYRIAVEDNGPGIVPKQVPHIFGRLLYGSKFHTLRQARGQQGIGISAAGMYAQLTTGRPTVILTRPGENRPAHRLEVQLDTRRNAPVVTREEKVEWEAPHGTRVEMELHAVYRRGPRSVDDYVEQTALMNPHARVRYVPPRDTPLEYERLTDALPREPQEIRPHPHGVELGALLRLLHETRARTLAAFLASEFSRVSARTAQEIVAQAALSPDGNPRALRREPAERLHRVLAQTKLMAPPTHCLSPLGEETLTDVLRRRTQAQFVAATSRPPAVYRGNPFLVEAAVAYGDPAWSAEEPVSLLRYANRVPLLYQQSACAVTRAATALSWKTYGLQHPRGALPLGPLMVVVHIASVWVPFTSESKEAIAHYPEILREATLALQACGRQLGAHLRRRRRAAEADRKWSYLEKYLPHVGIALREMLSLSAAQETEVVERLRQTLGRSRS